MATLARDDPGLDFPEAWIWDEDGEQVSGSFVRFTRGHTKSFGSKVIAVLEVDGEQRSIWLTQTVLFNKFQDELRERPARNLTVGEKITIRRAVKIDSPDAMGAYWRFQVVFHDKPELSVEDLFDLDGGEQQEPAKAEPAEMESSLDDDGIPY